MSLVTREMAAQTQGDGHAANGDRSSSDLFALDHQANSQLAQHQDTHSNADDSRSYSAPQASFSSPTKPNSSMGKGAGGLADFFSQEVFQIVLHNPTTAHRLLKFSQARMCGENMEFLEKVPNPRVDCVTLS